MKVNIIKADNGYLATTDDHTYVGTNVPNVLAKIRHETDETIYSSLSNEGDSCCIEFTLSVVTTSDE